MSAEQQVKGSYANVITVDVVANGTDEDNKGRTLGDLRMIGQLPTSVELDDNYAALIVRTTNGVTTVSRSTTDEILVSARGFAKAMEALAAMFDRPVRVAADYGVSGGAVSKVAGIYGEQFAKTAPVAQADEISPTPETLTPAMVATLGVLGGTDGSLHGGTTSGEVKAVGGNQYSLTKAMGLGWEVRREPVKGAAEKRNSPTYTITAEGAAVLAAQMITIPTGTSECACQGIWGARQAGKVLPEGGLCCPSDGAIFVHTDTGPSEIVAAASSQVVDANARVKRAEYDAHFIPTNTPVIEGHEWKRHVNPGEQVWAGSTYQLIVKGSHCQVVATVKYREDGLWAAQGCSWGNPGLTEDYWKGESLAAAFANVVQYMDFLARARAAGLNGHDVFRADWRTWVAPLITDRDMRDQVTAYLGASGESALPIRTPGATLDTWDRAESEIWAGTDTVKMRFPRKLKKHLRHKFNNKIGVTSPSRLERKRARITRGR